MKAAAAIAAATAVGLLFIQKQPGAAVIGRLLFLAAQTTTVFPGSPAMNERLRDLI